MWNHHSVLHEDLIRVLEHADCGWLQCCCALGFAPARSSRPTPTATAAWRWPRAIAGKLIEAAESGVLPGVTVQ